VLAVPGEAPVAIPAYPAHATDTTGAGDAFCGAFISRWLAHPADLMSAARYAVQIAATVVTRFGGRP
jgi:ribokinase